MLAAPQAVRETALGTDGFLPQLSAGSLWIDCSTVDPAFSREMAFEAQKRNVRFVDAPVAGTKGPAEKGELIVLAGGSDSDIEEAEAVFSVIGKRRFMPELRAWGHRSRWS